MRRLALLLVPCLLAAAEDPREIVRRAVEVAREHDKVAANYTFVERQDLRETDSKGRTKKHEIRTYDVTLSEGTPYRRLIGRADKPLPPEEVRLEDQKLEKSITDRRNETPEQRKQRIADWENKRRKQRDFLKEVPDAFDFRILGEHRIDGRDVYEIEATPRPGYRPASSSARFLPKMYGKLWIDKHDYGWARIEAEVTETVSIGVFLARVHKGTRISLEQTRINDEIWLPKHMRIAASLRVALVKYIGGEWDYTYRDYRKFQADSRVVRFETGESGGPRE